MEEALCVLEGTEEEMEEEWEFAHETRAKLVKRVPPHFGGRASTSDSRAGVSF
jgi:hypothetical protein